MSIITIFMIILLLLGFVLFICFIITIGNIAAVLIIPAQYCPDDNTEMKIIMSNIYTGQVLYECPRCGKKVSYHYDENELTRENDGYKCSLTHKNFKTDKE